MWVYQVRINHSKWCVMMVCDRDIIMRINVLCARPRGSSPAVVRFALLHTNLDVVLNLDEQFVDG